MNGSPPPNPAFDSTPADTLALMHELRDFMFERVYLRSEQAAQQQVAARLLRRLMDHHLTHADELPASYRDTDAGLVTQVADYVSGMTDRYAQTASDRLFGMTAERLG